MIKLFNRKYIVQLIEADSKFTDSVIEAPDKCKEAPILGKVLFVPEDKTCNIISGQYVLFPPYAKDEINERRRVYKINEQDIIGVCDGKRDLDAIGKDEQSIDGNGNSNGHAGL